MQVDRTLLLKPIDATTLTSTPPTARQSTPESSTVVPPVTEVPDSADRRATRIQLDDETPAPVPKKVQSIQKQP